jgi:hypothetical protein
MRESKRNPQIISKFFSLVVVYKHYLSNPQSKFIEKKCNCGNKLPFTAPDENKRIKYVKFHKTLEVEFWIVLDSNVSGFVRRYFLKRL